MTKRIKLTQGLYALVDDEDYERINKYKWYANKIRYTYYAVSANYGKEYNGSTLMHRAILGDPAGIPIDHINHNGLDNRRENIRTCSGSQNNMNSRKSINRTSKYKGVSWCKSSIRWQVDIGIMGKGIYLGHFNNEIEAAHAYDTKAKELFGEFANTNF
jgi:hypothetical protein